MPSRGASPPLHLKRLTLSRVMTATAGLALAFAFLPATLSVAFAVTVLGVLTLDGMHVPQVTRGSGVRRWLPWLIWSLALTACPAAIAVVGPVYQHHGPSVYDRIVTRVVNGLGFVQLGLSVIASIVVVVLTPNSYRWLAWAAVLTVGAFTVILLLGALMATTGAYL
jgi:hypothetical protein